MSPLPEVQVGNNEPLYNIGVVARMTGLSMATLRAWERRYEFPAAERTAGGHRLFSEEDVMRLRWVKARIDEGLQTAQAIQALHHQEATGHLVHIDEALEASRTEMSRNGDNPHLGIYQGRLYEILLRRDIQGADSLLGDALAVFSPEDLILDVLNPTFTQIGDAWENGKISVATEHLATNYLRQRLLMWMLSGPPARRVRPIVMACAPDEWHEGSLLMIGALLRRQGWPVAYLGQAVPLPDLAAFIRDIRPPLVVLVAMTEKSASALLEWPQWLPEAAQEGRPVMSYGGRIFTLQPEWRLKMGGIYLGDSLRDGLRTIERLLPQI
jgi:DNA-binding transcriptional MerR regulator/methanogenic corrinoid protein MtbC1